MSLNYLNHLIRLRDKSIINRDAKSVNKYNNEINRHLENKALGPKSPRYGSHQKKSSRFSVRKQRPNVSRDASSMGYAKPIHNQRIFNKYNCMVTGEKRMDPCAGCSNVKGCISSSMQYKEH